MKLVADVLIALGLVGMFFSGCLVMFYIVCFVSDVIDRIRGESK